uniref:Myxovirus (influenza virus) resistance F n=1 Tax=Cyprinus carpio TaxID=7962 RepID=A0A8C1LR27_CYPCA
MDGVDKLIDYDSQGTERSFSELQTHGAFHNHFIESVQPLIELIDSLRLIGIDKDMDLPSIAVVGDQSSGKSSVLEALSGVALPRGSGIVTRCPLELKLRKLKKGPWSGAISYSGHKEKFNDPLKVDNLVREAQNKLAGNAVGISDELISLEILSPDVCDLTLIDLPGITRVPVHGQPDDIADQIKNLILKYIAKSETIILVVVPCNVDIATTEALRMAQDKSLPYLTEQIQTGLVSVQRELKNYDQGPPLEVEKMGPFLSEIIMEFSDQINELSRTGHSKDRNIHALIHPVFKNWDNYLRVTTKVTEMIDKYNEMHRGRELLTFSDFCEFESVIKDHVAALQEPAMATLKHVRGTIVQNVFKEVCKLSFDQYPQMRYTKMINDIQSKQEAKVEKRIKEFIDMEQLVFTQDKVLQRKLDNSDVPQKAMMDTDTNVYDDENKIFNSKGCALLDTRNLVPDKLVLYYEVVYQRLTDYVPMLIILFMLKDAAKMLRHQMLELRNEADAQKLLSEDSDRGRRRSDLKQRLERLTQAQELISNRL